MLSRRLHRLIARHKRSRCCRESLLWKKSSEGVCYLHHPSVIICMMRCALHHSGIPVFSMVTLYESFLVVKYQNRIVFFFSVSGIESNSAKKNNIRYPTILMGENVAVWLADFCASFGHTSWVRGTHHESTTEVPLCSPPPLTMFFFFLLISPPPCCLSWCRAFLWDVCCPASDGVLVSVSGTWAALLRYLFWHTRTPSPVLCLMRRRRPGRCDATPCYFHPQQTQLQLAVSQYAILPGIACATQEAGNFIKASLLAFVTYRTTAVANILQYWRGAVFRAR